MDALGIGQLAKRGSVGIDTVRYYERNGLLAPHTRLASGYRRYRDIELARLRFIRRAQTLACPGHGRAADCPILRALTEDDAK
jgi:DNA-binding transcriptional MerR regulator